MVDQETLRKAQLKMVEILEAIDNVCKKKNRTILSFISIMLSSAIIFVSLTLFSTVFTLSKTLDNEQYTALF